MSTLHGATLLGANFGVLAPVKQVCSQTQLTNTAAHAQMQHHSCQHMEVAEPTVADAGVLRLLTISSSKSTAWQGPWIGSDAPSGSI